MFSKSLRNRRCTLYLNVDPTSPGRCLLIIFHVCSGRSGPPHSFYVFLPPPPPPAALFNIAPFCVIHAWQRPGMVNVTGYRCEHRGCNLAPSYGFLNKASHVKSLPCVSAVTSRLVWVFPVCVGVSSPDLVSRRPHLILRCAVPENIIVQARLRHMEVLSAIFGTSSWTRVLWNSMLRTVVFVLLPALQPTESKHKVLV